MYVMRAEVHFRSQATAADTIRFSQQETMGLVLTYSFGIFLFSTEKYTQRTFMFMVPCIADLY